MAEATTPPRAVSKRDRSTPTGQMPQRPKKRVPLRDRDHTLGYVPPAGTRRPLFPQATPGTWSPEKVKALVEFVLFHGDPGQKWPTHKHDDFWASAVRFVQTQSCATLRRTGEK